MIRDGFELNVTQYPSNPHSLDASQSPVGRRGQRNIDRESVARPTPRRSRATDPAQAPPRSGARAYPDDLPPASIKDRAGS